MPVYAPAPGFAEQRRHPRALFLIVGVHAVAIAAVMTAKMDLPVPVPEPPIRIKWIDELVPPPPEPIPQPSKPRTRAQSTVDRIPSVIKTPTTNDPTFDPTPIKDPGPIVGTNLNPGPVFDPAPITAPVRVAARFATPDWLVKPPYPADKQRLEEEATLKLRLSIDEHGRVIAVEPMGRADPSFLEAARRHLMAKWRYKPATEDGRPIPSSAVITLRFELES